VSGAQWSAESLESLARQFRLGGKLPIALPRDRLAADALRAFARVVSVLERVTWPDSVQVSSVIGGFRARAGTVECVGDTPLALADALDAGGE
jgi:hypothetical protein